MLVSLSRPEEGTLFLPPEDGADSESSTLPPVEELSEYDGA